MNRWLLARLRYKMDLVLSCQSKLACETNSLCVVTSEPSQGDSLVEQKSKRDQNCLLVYHVYESSAGFNVYSEYRPTLRTTKYP